MSAGLYTTKLSDLLDPQVVADFVEKKLVDAIRLSPLAVIDRTLEGRPGDILTLPTWGYVGDAETVTEGNDIPIAKLTQTTATVQISKIGRAVEFTDEALLSGYNNDIAQQAGEQILTALNSGVEVKLLAQMASQATKTAQIAANVTDVAGGIADALTQFGEDMDGEGVLAIPPAFYTKLRKSGSWIPNTEIGADMIVRGRVGMVHGLQVVPMNRLTPASGDATAYIIKPGALAIFMKRDTLIEFDRDKLAQLNYIIGSKMFAPYVYDTSKLIKVTLKAS